MNFAKCRGEQCGGESSRASGSWPKNPPILTTLPHAPFPWCYIVKLAPPNRRLPISTVSIEPNCPSCPGEPHTTAEKVLAEEKKHPHGRLARQSHAARSDFDECLPPKWRSACIAGLTVWVSAAACPNA